MTTSVYFNHIESTPEQNLHQDLIIEAIKNYGIDVYYLPRKYVNEDLLYGEDTISEFNQAHLIEMYVKSVDGFEGEGDFVSRFGLEIRDQVVFSVARRRFDNLDITEQDRQNTESGFLTVVAVRQPHGTYHTNTGAQYMRIRCGVAAPLLFT